MKREEIEQIGNNHAHAVIMQLIGCFGWGVSYLLIKKALAVAPESILLATRFLLAFLILNLMLVFRLGKIRKGKRNWRPLIFQCISEPLYFICETLALRYVTITLESVVLATVPVFALGAGYFIIKEVPTLKQVVCCIFAIIGVILVTLSGKEIGEYNLKGIILLIMACILAALYRTFNKKACREFSFFERTYFVIGTCAVFDIVLALKDTKGDISLWVSYIKIPEFIIPVLILAFFCSVVGSMLINASMQGLSVVVFSIIAMTNTVIAVLCGVLFDGDRLTLQVTLGIIITIISMLGVSISVKNPMRLMGRKLKHSDEK